MEMEVEKEVFSMGKGIVVRFIGSDFRCRGEGGKK